MQDHRRAFILIFSCLALSACASQAIAPQLSTRAAVEITAPTSTSALREPSPDVTTSVPGNPAGTPAPFIRASNAPAAGQPAGAATETVEPETAAKETQLSGFAGICDANFDEFPFSLHSSLLSPAGNWLAVSCGYKKNQTLHVNNKAGKKWVLHFKDFLTEKDLGDGQIPMGDLAPVHWTSDERYLYFYSHSEHSAGGACFYGGLGQGLFRLDVDSGKVKTILRPYIDGRFDYLFSFSPSGRWLVHNTGIPAVIEMGTGQNIILQDGAGEVGDFSWSPDGASLMYSTCQSSEDGSVIVKSSVRILTLESRKTRTVLETDTENVMYRIEPVDDRRLKIYDGKYYYPAYSIFDWSSEQLIAPAVTPSP